MELQSGEIEENAPRPAPAAPRTPPTISRDRNFVPSPFMASAWEYVGERPESDTFIPIRVNVIEQEGNAPDEMFEIFDSSNPKVASLQHAPGKEMYRQEHEGEDEDEEISSEILDALLAEKFEEGRQAGYQEGSEATKAQLQHHVTELRAHLDELSAGLKTGIENFFAKTETETVNLALLIAQRILQTTVDVRPDYIIDVVRDALRQLGAGKPQRIRISPQDYEFMMVVGLPPDISAQELGVEYVADDAIRSGCVVESDFGTLELEIDKMWEQINGELYTTQKED